MWARIEPFERLWRRYDAWFERHGEEYGQELAAVREVLPDSGIGLEIGVGTGRFAAPLGIPFGVEPSQNMAALARRRGITTCSGLGEDLPFKEGAFDYVLLAVTMCFLTEPEVVLKEARRALKDDGVLVVGFIDSESNLGRKYGSRARKNRFYSVARFFSVGEIEGLLKRSGMKPVRSVQTLLRDGVRKNSREIVKEGTGEGAFVVITAVKDTESFT